MLCPSTHALHILSIPGPTCVLKLYNQVISGFLRPFKELHNHSTLPPLACRTVDQFIKLIISNTFCFLEIFPVIRPTRWLVMSNLAHPYLKHAGRPVASMVLKEGYMMAKDTANTSTTPHDQRPTNCVGDRLYQVLRLSC